MPPTPVPYMVALGTKVAIEPKALAILARAAGLSKAELVAGRYWIEHAARQKHYLAGAPPGGLITITAADFAEGGVLAELG